MAIARSHTSLDTDGERERLLALWSGEFGDAYVDRNADVARHRAPFWDALLSRFPVASALEIGCNVGGNLEHVARNVGVERTAGVDVNARALEVLAARLPAADLHRAPADALPFADGAFELVFTMTVLIHLPPALLPAAVNEVVRCSSRYVLCGEYQADEPTGVHYRGHDGALFKRDWCALYRDLHPSLALRATGFLPLDDTQAWDDVTWFLFEKA
jgi:spore coat polysaccharide biosynthesis protein SpsF